MDEAVIQKEWQRISAGSEARDMLASVEEYIAEIDAHIDQTTFSAINNDKLTPDLALLAFGRKHGLYLLRAKLAQRLTAATRAVRAMNKDQKNAAA